MTPSSRAPRKPRASRALASRSGHGAQGLRAGDHPGSPEAVGDHAEAMGPEGLLDRHGDLAAVRQRREDPLRLGGLLDRRHHVEALGRVVVLCRRVAAEEALASEIDPRVDDLVARFRRGLLRARRFAVGHREHDLAAEGPGVEVERLTAVAVEMQMGAGLHGLRSGECEESGALRVSGRRQCLAPTRSRCCASCARSSGVRFAPKSSASNTRRISISSLPFWNGERRIHSMASSMDFTCHSQKPAISSLVSVKGPSITRLLPPPNLTRPPLALECSPSPASITPAFTSSSLNLPISLRISRLGSTPASESLFALTITMTRMTGSFFGYAYGSTTSEPRGNRHGRPARFSCGRQVIESPVN